MRLKWFVQLGRRRTVHAPLAVSAVLAKVVPRVNVRTAQRGEVQRENVHPSVKQTLKKGIDLFGGSAVLSGANQLAAAFAVAASTSLTLRVKPTAVKPPVLTAKSAALEKASPMVKSVLAVASTNHALRVKVARAANLARRVKVQAIAAHRAAASATVHSAGADFTPPPGA